MFVITFVFAAAFIAAFAQDVPPTSIRHGSEWVDLSLSMRQTVAGMRLVVAPAHAQYICVHASSP